jgi:hypothetical protein
LPIPSLTPITASQYSNRRASAAPWGAVRIVAGIETGRKKG